MAKCKSCVQKRNQAVYGFEDAPYIEIVSAVVSNYAAKKLDEMLTTDESGAPKEGFLTDNPMVKNAGYLAIGVGLTAFMKGEMYKGAGIGLAVYGGMELINSLMNPAVTGLRWQPPQNIAGLRTLPGNYGIAPNLVAGHESGYQGSNYAQEELYEKTAVQGLVRAL